MLSFPRTLWQQQRCHLASTTHNSQHLRTDCVTRRGEPLTKPERDNKSKRQIQGPERASWKVCFAGAKELYQQRFGLSVTRLSKIGSGVRLVVSLAVCNFLVQARHWLR